MSLSYTTTGEMEMSGDVEEILLTDISGMYKLVPAKQTDSYYNTQAGLLYVTVAIPNPNFKLAYPDE